MTKCTSLLLIITLAVSSLIMVESAFAQSIPKPSVPEFTLKYIDNSFDVPPTYSMNQFTGKTVVTTDGYHEENKSIEVAIKNLPFTPLEGSNLELFYQVEWKGYFGEFWTGLNISSSNSVYVQSDGNRHLLNPDAVFSVVSIGFNENNGSSRYVYSTFISEVPDGGQIDFRVRALIGYHTRINDTDAYVPGIPVNDPTDPIPHHYVFTGETSGWSNTQTISIPDGSVSISASPSSAPDQTTEPAPSQTTEPAANDTSQTLQLAAIIGTVVAVVVLCTVLLVYFKKRKHQSTSATTNNS